MKLKDLAPWKNAMTNLDSILKSRDITSSTKVHLVKAMVFPVAMYECESWTMKKAECRRTDTSELWCWRRLLRVLWTARRSNQSILKEISPGCLLEGLMLKLKLQYFGYLMQWTNSFEKTLMLGKIEGRRRRGRQRMRWLVGWHHRLNGHEFGSPPGVGDGQGGLACCDSWCLKESDTTEWLNWIELNIPLYICILLFSCSVLFNSLWPHGLQHARLPCPSPSHETCPNSSSIVPFSSCPQSFLASGSFPMSQFFTSGGQSIGVSASTSVLPMNV